MSISYGTLSARGTLIAIFLFISAGPLYALSPVAAIDVDEQYPCKDETVYFDGSASYDPDNGTIQEYDWTFPAAATNIQDDNTDHPSCEFNAPGIHLVTLKVQDEQEEWSDEVSIDLFVGNPDLVECYVSTFPEGDDETGNGSIDQPFATIQHAIYSVCDGATIYIKPGIYIGEGNYNVRFYGRAITVMNLALHNSAYTGEVAVDCQEQGRGFTFVSDDIDCVLEGVVINNGKDRIAGAIYTSGSPTIRECKLINNESTYVYGGGGFKISGGSPRIINCWVTDNYAPSRGGGFYIWKESPEIRGCVIARNSTGNQGSAIFRDSRNSAALFINCSIWNNSARYGGAFYDRGNGTPTFVNCILWGNSASTSGGEIYAAYSSCNITVNYSDVEGGLDGPKCAGSVQPQGEHNIDADPLLENPTENDFHLIHNSPCINAGDPSRDYTDQADIDGEARVLRLIADIGADEFSGRPISHWKLDETSGSIACDSSGYGHVGTLIGDPAWNPNGSIGGALEFDGDGDYIEIEGYRGISGGQQRTVAAWIKTDDGGDIVSWGTNQVNGNKWRFRVTGGKVAIQVQGGYVESSTTINDDNWHHVTVVLEDVADPCVSDIKLYVDGEEDNPCYSNLTLPINTAEYAYVEIGNFSLGYNDHFNGLIDDVRIYNRALSDAEIAALAYARIHNVTNDTWYMNIQDAIDSSSEFDIVELYPGTYYEQINFEGRAVTLRSTDPSDPLVVDETIIDGDGNNVIVFDNGEDSGAIIEGVKITGGGNGVFCGDCSSPQILNCHITGNSSSGISVEGASQVEPSPIISGCRIDQNASYGIYVVYGSNASTSISDCEINNNSSYGIYLNHTQGTVHGCNIYDNNCSGVRSSYSTLNISNCVIAENNCSPSGTGIIFSDDDGSTVVNCTIAGHLTYGINGVCDEVKNCIIWDNNNDINCGSAVVSYSCIEDMDDGLGIIHIDPVFIDSDNGDYHLWYSSECIDAGDPADDSSLEPSGGSGLINMGAYGNTSEAQVIVDSDTDGMDDNWEISIWGDTNHTADADEENSGTGDGLRNIDEYHIMWDPTIDDTVAIAGCRVDNDRTGLRFPTLNWGIRLSHAGDTLTVNPATYNECVYFNGKNIHITGTDPSVVDTIIIDGDGNNVIVFDNGEDSGAIIEGVKITGGGNGVFCGDCGSPQILNCHITGNSSSGISVEGASQVEPSPIISGCRIDQNASYGIYVVYGSNASTSILDCEINNNSSYGIYLNHTQGTVHGCNIYDNNCSGVRSSYSTLNISNCVIAENNCSPSGTGIIFSDDDGSTVVNCTIVGHLTYGINGVCDEVKNCIIWDHNNDINCGSAVVSYSCIEDMDDGLGVIHIDPSFDSNTNYELQADSLCIDAGAPWCDWSNEPTSNGGRINMGAYGNTSDAATTTDVDADGISDNWELHYWPSDSPGDHNPIGNPDGDNFSNWVEYLFGYDPTSATTAGDLLKGDIWNTQFDPTESDSIDIGYIINTDKEMVITITNTDTGEIVRTITESVDAGLTLQSWDGKDANDLIVEEGNYEIRINVSGASCPGDECLSISANLEYEHRIEDLKCWPSRIIPANREVISVSFVPNTEDSIVVEIYNPEEELIATLTDSGSHTIIWNGKNDENKYVGTEGQYTVKARYANMREYLDKSISVYK